MVQATDDPLTVSNTIWLVESVLMILQDSERKTHIVVARPNVDENSESVHVPSTSLLTIATDYLSEAYGRKNKHKRLLSRPALHAVNINKLEERTILVPVVWIGARFEILSKASAI